MNCYDFDKTIYKKDSSIEFFKFALKKRACLGFLFICTFFAYILYKLHFITTKRFKEIFFKFITKFDNKEQLINEFWNKEEKNIADWYLKQKSSTDIICSASPYFLVNPIMQKINPDCQVFATDMNVNTGKINGENLKGEEKKLLLEKNGLCEFDAVYTDSLSDFPLLDMGKEKYLVCNNKVYKFGEQKPNFFVKIKYFFKLLRIKHYIKNGLILMPLFFCGKLMDATSLLTVLLGIVSFCMISSFVYIVNDIIDAPKDRLHSKKRKRPIASYMVKPYEAIILAIILFCGSLSINLFLIPFSWLNCAIIVIYAIVNLLYSLYLKNIPIVDVFTLSACYLLRLFYGGAIISVSISKWLYLTVLCASLYMGLGKRRNEIQKQSKSTRKVYEFYNYNFLDKNLYVCMALSLVFYSLWAIEIRPLNIEYLNGYLLLATIPIVYFIMMRYSLCIENNNSDGDPINVVLKDKFLLFIVACFVILLVISIYFNIPNFVMRGAR